jgi:hypothetical protein
LTDANGNFKFTSLDNGSYTVTENHQYGFVQTTPTSNGTYSIGVSSATEFSTSNNFGNHQGHVVSATWPKAFSTTNDPGVQIRVLFDTAFISATFDDTVACVVTGDQSGRHLGTFAFSGDTATFSPNAPFLPGETVRMDISSVVKSADNISLVPYLLQFSIRATSGPGTLGIAGTYSTGMNPYAVAAGDLNGDGYSDFVVANNSSNSVSVFINNGDGTFKPGVSYAVGTGPKSVAIADINNDGFPDIIAGNSGTSTFSVLKNNGNGTFQTHADYSSGGSTYSIAAADITGDGYIDVVSIVPGYSSINIAANNGPGTFATPSSNIVNGQPQGGYVADINGDGGLDVVVSVPNNTSNIVTKENVGAGLLNTASTLNSGAYSHGVFVADLNGDRLPDIVTTNSTSNNVSIFMNTGSGLYGAGTTVPTGTYPYAVACADLDGDSLIDIVVTNVTGNSITVLHNNGGGSFTRKDYTVGSTPTGVAIADFNGDGKPDVVVVNSGSNTASVFLNSSVLSVEVNASWNLVSVPQPVADLAKTSLYPTATSEAFGYKAGYVVKDTLVVGQGYWLKFDTAATVSFLGTTAAVETVSVSAGWNLVGSMGVSIDTSYVSAVPYGNLETGFFGYNNGYANVSTLVPGSGYWVKVAQSGTLILNAQHAAPRTHPAALLSPAFSSLTLQDAAGHAQSLYFRSGSDGGSRESRFEMPPAPPAGVFDARFADQTIAKIVDPSSPGDFAISVHGATGALQVSVNVQPAERGAWVLADAETKHLLGGKQSLAIANPGKLSLVLNAAAGAPRAFALAQNYPNPFNPSTNVQYDVAAPSHVTMKIVDVLGREVATLVDREMPAGRYTQVWNADNYAAGVYYVSLLARSESGAELFRTVKKLMLVK